MLDSGCFSHLFKSKNLFQTLVETSELINTGKPNAALEVKEKGSVMLHLPGTTLQLKDSFWVPEACISLISMGRLLRKGLQLKLLDPNIDKRTFVLLRNSGVVLCGRISKNDLLVNNSDDNMAMLHKSTHLISPEELEEIHLLLGHTGIGRMRIYLKDKNLTPPHIHDFVCKNCSKSKIIRNSFSQKASLAS